MVQFYSPPPAPPSPSEFNLPVHRPVPMPPHMVPVHHRMPMPDHHHNREQEVEAVTKMDQQQKEHKDHGATSSKNGLFEEAALKILNQVEYYFSDLNLATTDHLMRFISKDPEGYVPISVVASFKKIKALITTHSQLARVLRKSLKLVVSKNGKKVRRRHPLTESDREELQSRIIVAENLPKDHCHQNLMKIFSAVGSVKTICICHPQPSGGVVSSASRSEKSDCMHLSNKLHAFVEYESVELAEKAVAELNDEGNWRIGIRVRLMLGRVSKPAHARGKKGHDAKGHYEEDHASTSEQQSIEKQEEDPSQLSDIHSQECRGSRRSSQLVKNTITGSNNHLSFSSSGSIEAPRCCLRFLLSPSKTHLNRYCPTTRTAHFISKSPKSAPISRLPHSKCFHFVKKNSSSKSISHKLYQVKKVQSSKKSTSETPAFLDSNIGAPVTESLSMSQDLLKLPDVSEELQFTPMAVSKIATCSTLDCLVAGIGNHKNRLMDDDKSNTSSSNTKTPPIQASFSPEIQSTTITATTPACYGAGHLISRVTDRRKCKARGVLAVALPGTGDNNISINNYNNVDCEDYATGLDKNCSVSMPPLPAEASMHWLLSPCHEDNEDDKENSAPFHSLLEHKTLPSPSSPLSDLGLSLDWCNLSNNTSDATNSSTEKSQKSINNMLISTEVPQFQVRLDSLCDDAPVSSSPNATPYSRAVPLKEGAKHSYNIGGNSPFSADTLGSENVMQTPSSDSSLERHIGLSCSSARDHKRHHLHSERLSVAGDLRMASLSPESHVSIWDTNGSSFQFDRLTTPSNSMDLSQFQKILDDQSLWTSNSAFENVSQSHMRISWREGLVSRIFEMDEFDGCRCLSDEEEDLNVNSSDPCKSCQSLEINVDLGNIPTLTNACGSTEFLDGESKEKLHSPVQCSCAESISTDGGGLARSEDSDWNLCYKNNLFEV
ncbi:uncharacterized protein LOC111293702 isoform X2 [Durio zibethinus]|uniref:Uncharacterized protein LOC111293702 isoform X2 n=1 Tax=Durio zibethinus TaxID=66656 RepID=A0A6P5YQC5_DURZI|nr:uncharacterized protein LOC111293702 isoform X2 [Durio zibethinus]